MITTWARHRHKESGSRDNNPGEQSVGIWEACHKGKVLSLSWAQITVKSDRRAGLPEMHDMETEGLWREGSLEISLLLGMALWLQARILESSFFKQTAC